MDAGADDDATWLGRPQRRRDELAHGGEDDGRVEGLGRGSEGVSRPRCAQGAREFLRFVVSADVQTTINNPDNLGQLPVNASSSVADDKFLNEGFAMLSSNSPGGVAQFFDRDFPAEMAAEAMQGFQEFMVFPDNLEDILDRLEAAREDIY